MVKPAACELWVVNIWAFQHHYPYQTTAGMFKGMGMQPSPLPSGQCILLWGEGDPVYLALGRISYEFAPSYHPTIIGLYIYTYTYTEKQY